MKKAFLCALLALLLVMSCAVCMPAVLAENACPCACGVVSDVVTVDSDEADDPLSPFILTLPEPEPEEEPPIEYTQEVVVGDYRVFIPSACRTRGNPSDRVFYSLDDPDVAIFIDIDEFRSSYARIDYTDIDDCREALYYISYYSDYIPVRVDECIGALVPSQIDSYFHTDLYVSNRKQVLNIDILTDTEDVGRELMAGILEHIVAPIQTRE